MERKWNTTNLIVKINLWAWFFIVLKNDMSVLYFDGIDPNSIKPGLISL